MSRAQAIISRCLGAGKYKVAIGVAGLIAIIACIDWSVGNTVSLGVLYVLPMMLGAVVLGAEGIAALAFLCSLLRSWFDTPGSHAEVILRFIFAFVSYFSAGLFVAALVRNRKLAVDHLHQIQREQQRRREAEEQLKILVESSPAAILTLDSRGTVLAANRAANAMFTVRQPQTLVGQAIASYVPVLSDALRLQIGPDVFRTAAQCQAKRDNGEIFSAHTWFSSYAAADGVHLAAIVVDSSEEMRDREEQNLLELLEHNRIAAAALSHEVRNFCGAMHLVSSNLRDKHALVIDEDYQGLANLINGLEKVASFNLQWQVSDLLEEVPLQAVFDDLRIIVDTEWREMGATVCWPSTPMPRVLGEPHGLLQVFLNLVQNSYRALQDCPKKELTLAVAEADGRVIVRLEDSGPGISAPERLFQPFQPGSNGAGLGLYISRAIVRSYGGELRFEPREIGSRFVVELPMV